MWRRKPPKNIRAWGTLKGISRASIGSRGALKLRISLGAPSAPPLRSQPHPHCSRMLARTRLGVGGTASGQRAGWRRHCGASAGQPSASFQVISEEFPEGMVVKTQVCGFREHCSSPGPLSSSLCDALEVLQDGSRSASGDLCDSPNRRTRGRRTLLSSSHSAQRPSVGQMSKSFDHLTSEVSTKSAPEKLVQTPVRSSGLLQEATKNQNKSNAWDS